MINAVSQSSAGVPVPPTVSMPAVTPVVPPAPVAQPVSATLPPFQPPVPSAPFIDDAANIAPPPTASMSPQPKKKAFPVKGVIGLLILILTVVGGGAAFFLSRTSQDIRQQASTGDYVCAPWTVTCNDGTTGTEASCSVQNLFGNDRNTVRPPHRQE